MELIESILLRARTYQVPQWRYQSHPLLNPYKLSSQGYWVTQQDLLECQICQHQVLLTEQNEMKIEQIQQQLKQHEQNCIYREDKNEEISKEDMYIAIEDLMLSIKTLSIKPTAFPLINSKKLQQFVSSNSLLYRKVLALYQIDYKHYKISLILQIMGWYFTKNAQQEECLSCYFCGRSLSLSNFKLTTEDVQEGEEQVPTEQLFDPVNEHRYFCLWVGKQQGWLTFLQHLEDKFIEVGCFRFRTPTLETKRLRVHIQKFIEGFKQKIENAITKLKGATQQATSIFQKIGEDSNLAIATEETTKEMKRLRESDHDLDELRMSVNNNLQYPLKKIKLN